MPRRVAARAVVVDHAYRVLLLHVTDGTATWWEPPGGDLAPREDAAAAALRVLREETGRSARIGPCVWERVTGRVLRRVERYFVAWLDDPTAPRAEFTERAGLLGERWWTLDELASEPDRFDPPELPSLAPALVRGDYAATPVRLAAP